MILDQPPAPSASLALPAPPTVPARASFPLVATLVPLIGGVALWAVIGSPFALLFALLGPLVALGGLVDQVQGGRRRRTRAEAEYAQALARLGAAVSEQHGRERRVLRSKHPDVAALSLHPERIWRASRGEPLALAVGRGTRTSVLRITGDASRPDAERLSADVGTLSDAPVTVDWRQGVAVRGEPALARAVLRGLVLQLCMGLTPEALRIDRPDAVGWEWMLRLPHIDSHAGGGADERAVVLTVGPADVGPARPGVLMTWGPLGSTIDPRCGVVLDVREPDDATLLIGTERVALEVEAVSAGQAAAVARVLADRGRALYGVHDDDAPVTFASVRDAAGVGDPGGLAIALGRAGEGAVVVDLVRDGPHAVVTGITGSGKSELLTTWITALCAAYSTREVSFLLADFKGGMTFDALHCLPHVTGVITDLDAGTAERAIASLRAELRRREHELALRGARDITDPRVDLPRLVIVVDEYAALLAEHDGLHRVFADVAARGRALGMHLIIGTQRVSGSVSDALLANCPLRVALRAADSADSRAILGDDSAVRLSGGSASRGRAYLRRASDTVPQGLRVALTSAEELGEVARAVGSQPAPRSPWLAALPALLALDELRADDPSAVLLALADDPARQRQFPMVLDEPGGLAVIGRVRSGKSSIISLIAAQRPDAVRVPHDLEAAWDALMGEGVRSASDGPTLWLVDDADDLLARFPPDHAVAAGDRLDRMARTGTLVMTARSLSGRVGRIVDALPQRAILALPTRADHLGAGGESSGFRPDLPPGRGRLGGWDVQFAHVPDREQPEPARPSTWTPGALSGVVTRQPDGIAAALRAEAGESVQVLLLRDTPTGVRLDAIRTRTGAAQILVGDGEEWLARWGLLQELRSRHPLVVDADCPAELRTVAGERSLAPYARPGAGRAWLCAPAARPVRVDLRGVTS